MCCPSCGFENLPEAQFCEDCGRKLALVCPSCGHEVRPTAKFCLACGTPLTRQTVLSVLPETTRPTITPLAEATPVGAESAPQIKAEGERRQLTVMFYDLVGSTALSQHLDPEELRAVILTYRETCAAAVSRFGGYLAKYIWDGLLVYFGYPLAHEDDAARSVRAGLEIVAALQKRVPSPFLEEWRGEGNKDIQHDSPHPTPRPRGARGLQVRVGIHTGLVVAGEMGTEDHPEPLAIVGETPNIAARIQGLAEPNTVIVSAATQRLIDGQFECQPFGSHLVKSIDTPIAIYHVQSERQNVVLLAGKTTLTPLVGREQEVGLLLDRWEQVKKGRGQVVLMSGEPGLGKSRLTYTLKEHVTAEGSLLFESRCSPYHQHSTLHPLIDVAQRTLLLTRQEEDEEKIAKVERVLTLYSMQEALPLFTTLLSLPTPAHYSLLNLTPQKQKERTTARYLRLEPAASL